MIFIDSDVFLIDLRYPRDERFAKNRIFLERLQASERGATAIFNLLEICGVLSSPSTSTASSSGNSSITFPGAMA